MLLSPADLHPRESVALATFQSLPQVPGLVLASSFPVARDQFFGEIFAAEICRAARQAVMDFITLSFGDRELKIRQNSSTAANLL